MKRDGIELQYKYRVNVWKSKKSCLWHKKALRIEYGWKMQLGVWTSLVSFPICQFANRSLAETHTVAATWDQIGSWSLVMWSKIWLADLVMSCDLLSNLIGSHLSWCNTSTGSTLIYRSYKAPATNRNNIFQIVFYLEMEANRNIVVLEFSYLYSLGTLQHCVWWQLVHQM